MFLRLARSPFLPRSWFQQVRFLTSQKTSSKVKPGTLKLDTPLIKISTPKGVPTLKIKATKKSTTKKKSTKKVKAKDALSPDLPESPLVKPPKEPQITIVTRDEKGNLFLGFHTNSVLECKKWEKLIQDFESTWKPPRRKYSEIRPPGDYPGGFLTVVSSFLYFRLVFYFFPVCFFVLFFLLSAENLFKIFLKSIFNFFILDQFPFFLIFFFSFF